MRTSEFVLCSPSRQTPKSRNACARHQKHVLSHITYPLSNPYRFNVAPNLHALRVCFVQPKSTNTEIKKRMRTPSKTCVFTHHLYLNHIDLECRPQPARTSKFVLCSPSRQTPKSRNACARHQKHVFSHITLYLNHIDLMLPPTCTRFRVDFTQAEST